MPKRKVHPKRKPVAMKKAAPKKAVKKKSPKKQRRAPRQIPDLELAPPAGVTWGRFEPAPEPTGQVVILLNDRRTKETPYTLPNDDHNPRSLTAGGVQYERAYDKPDGTPCYAPTR